MRSARLADLIHRSEFKSSAGQFVLLTVAVAFTALCELVFLSDQFFFRDIMDMSRYDPKGSIDYRSKPDQIKGCCIQDVNIG